MEVFTFKNTKTGKLRKANLTNVSLCDDVIVGDVMEYKILHMLTGQ